MAWKSSSPNGSWLQARCRRWQTCVDTLYAFASLRAPPSGLALARCAVDWGTPPVAADYVLPPLLAQDLGIRLALVLRRTRSYQPPAAWGYATN